MTDWDVIVIGAGPAGSSSATYLAQEGRRVLLLERETLPREHIGESLLPGVLPYLDLLGVRDAVEQEGFVRKEGQTFVWGRDRTPWELDFRELDVHPYAYFVERARFDELLAKNAERCGATLRQRARVREIVFEAGRAVGVRYTNDRNETHTERAKFIVDATGQSALVARGARLRKLVRGLKSLAVWAYWRGAERLPGHQAAHILTVSTKSGWIWCIPLRDRMSVGVVTSHEGRPTGRAELDAFYRDELRAAEPVWALLKNAEPLGPVTSARDWSYRSRKTSGPGIFLAGDAACFVDPILSTGVHLAMTSARWAAACIHSSLRSPAHEPLYRKFYDEQYATTFGELLAQVKSFYRVEGRRDSVYWRARTILRTRETLPPRLAFLFITAGLLRNAAEPEPNEVGDAVARAVGRARAARDGAARETAATLTPPRPLRVGPDGAARLVTLRTRGLDLEIVPYEARGVRDRPRGRYFAEELLDASGHPLALAIVEEASAAGRGAEAVRSRDEAATGRMRVRVLPYPARPADHETLRAAERALAEVVAELDDRAAPLRVTRLAVALRKRIHAEGSAGPVRLARRASFRGPKIGDPPVTLVLATGSAAAPKIYVRAEPRLPPELVEIPPLRTRYLDIWVEPGVDREGRRLEDVAELAPVVALLERVMRALWERLATAANVGAALAETERVLNEIDVTGATRIACGRLVF
jgi:clorobiocin biosynthesis protein Clo-hal